MKACKKLTTEEINNLSDIARYFFNFVQSFGNKLRVHNFVNLQMVEDPIQNLDTVTGGIFQIYFYDDLISPDENSKIQSNKKLTK